MKKILFSIHGINVAGYGLMIAIGIISAYLVAEKRAKKYNLEPEYIFDIAVWCLIGGMLGSRTLYYTTVFSEILKEPKILIDFSEGYVVYGGIIGGILAGYIFSKVKKLDFLEYFDLVMPSIALAQGIGRIGCFLAGCCYGRETTSGFGVVFPADSIAPHGISLVPTQIISSVLDFMLFYILIVFAKHKKGSGQVAGVYLILYSIGRFILEFFRGDLARGTVGTLTTSQFISIFILVAGIIVTLLTSKKNNNATA